MPASYQAPKRQDQAKQSSQSQSASSNTQSGMATVAAILKGKGNAVFTINPDDTLHQAVELLRDKGIGAVLATDESGALCGLLSERDIVRKLADTPGQTLAQRVEDVMTVNVEVCAPDDPLISVLRRMTEGRFRHMPVVEDGKLIGIVTIGDVVKARLSQLSMERDALQGMIAGH